MTDWSVSLYCSYTHACRLQYLLNYWQPGNTTFRYSTQQNCLSTHPINISLCFVRPLFYRNERSQQSRREFSAALFLQRCSFLGNKMCLSKTDILFSFRGWIKVLNLSFAHEHCSVLIHFWIIIFSWWILGSKYDTFRCPLHVTSLIKQHMFLSHDT